MKLTDYNNKMQSFFDSVKPEQVSLGHLLYLDLDEEFGRIAATASCVMSTMDLAIITGQRLQSNTDIADTLYLDEVKAWHACCERLTTYHKEMSKADIDLDVDTAADAITDCIRLINFSIEIEVAFDGRARRKALRESTLVRLIQSRDMMVAFIEGIKGEREALFNA